MLRLSKLTDYATVIMSSLAREPITVSSAADLSARVKLEIPTVSKVLKALSKAGLVNSFRGVHGGYLLARAPAQITILDIIEALEGKTGLTECAVHDGLCTQEAVCAIRNNWRKINRAVTSALEAITLVDMLCPLPYDAYALRMAHIVSKPEKSGAQADSNTTSKGYSA